MFSDMFLLVNVPFTIDTFKRDIQINGYPENFTDRCFKLFLNRIHILKEKVPAVEKKPLRLVFLYLGIISLQTRTKLLKSIKGVLKCGYYRFYRLFSKVKINSVIIFTLKTLFFNFLHQVWFTSCSVDYAMNSITENALDVLL